MARSQDELRQLFNAGTATDADMDEYINAGYDYNVLGPKSKAFYDQRKAAMSAASAPTQPQPVVQSPSESPPEQVKKDPASRYKLKSIQQAYYDGDIDKDTRDYMVIDTIAKFARNMGKDIGNVAAAYSGGTVNNEREQSAWDARNAEMMKQGISSEAATVENSDKNVERALQKIEMTAGNLKNEQGQYTLSAARALKDAYEKAPASSTIKYILAGLISDVSDGNISEGALMALATAGGVQDVANIAKKVEEEKEKQRSTVDVINKEFGTKFSSVKDIRKIVLKKHPEMSQSTDEDIIEKYKEDVSALKASTKPGWYN